MFSPESQQIIAAMCRDFVYFAQKGPYYVPHRAFMTLDGFRQFCGQHYGVLEYTRIVDGQEITDSIPSAEYWLSHRVQGKQVAAELVFEPGVDTGPERYNTWTLLREHMCPPCLDANLSDIEPFIRHLSFLCDGEDEAVVYFLNWLACLYQRPDVKIPTYICLHSKFGGAGKSMLKLLLAPVFGAPMVKSMSGHMLHGDFTDPLFEARIVFVEEVAFENRRSTYEKFKELVSEPDYTHNPKGRTAFRARNTAHFIVCTNQADALPLMEKDRRACVLSTLRDPKPQDYYRELVAWMKGPGPELLAGVLADWDLSGFDPGQRPPRTKAQEAMEGLARPPLEQLILDCIENRDKPFDKDFGQSGPLASSIQLHHPGVSCNSVSIGRALGRVGAHKLGLRVGDKSGYFWVWRNIQYWQDIASIEQRAAHLVGVGS